MATRSFLGRLADWATFKPRPPSAAEPGFVESEDTAPLAPLPAPEGLREPSAERGPAVESPSGRSLDDAARRARAPAWPTSPKRDDHSRQAAFDNTGAPRPPAPPVHSSNWRHQRQALGQRGETMSDLERLIATIPPDLRDQTAPRLPRSTPLGPVPGLAPAGERFQSRDYSPLSLQTERLEPPPANISRRGRRRWPRFVLLAGILATPIAYHFTVGGRGPGVPVAAVGSNAVEPPSASKEQRRPARVQENDVGASAPNEMTSRPEELPQGKTVATLQPDQARTENLPLKKTVRALDPEEVRFLMEQGNQFAKAGDLVTARILFQRAAEADDAMAAMALAATYDPTVLAKIGVVGIGADVQKARYWYEKAVSLGSSEAKQRLDLLANR
jgi:hypothetical protein